MKKIIMTISIVLLCAIITGCSKEDEEEATPAERFDTYVEKWNKQDFTNMYDFLSEEAAVNYPTEDFIDRYQNIYNELEVQNLHISYDSLDQEALNEANETGEAELDFSVEMETVG